MVPWEFITASVEREPRGGRERTPVYAHYHDIITPREPQPACGLDVVIDSRGRVKERITDQCGNTVQRL